jgi:UDP:flavonoid glycosyltransferase YjiC (YdhE family)
MPGYDIAVLADLRFPGGTSAAVAEELKAAAAAGYRTAVLPLKAAVLRQPHPVHPEIAAAVQAGLAELVDPEEPLDCGLALVHHPQLFTRLPQAPLRVRADRRLLVAHHPPRDALGQPFYDLAAVALNTAEALGGEVVWAPVGPAVRDQLAASPEPPPLAAEDWVNVLDPEPWRTRRGGAFADELRCVVGRHSRPDPLKWPASRAEVLEVYPDDPAFRVRVLGGGPYLDALLGGPPPPNWEVLPFAAGAAPAFLRGVDFFLYYHHPRWVEAFGRTILEALAAGCAAVLPPSFARLFGEGAVYAEPAEAPAAALALREDPVRFRVRSAVGEAVARERFGPARHRARLQALLGAPRPRAAPPARPARRRTRRAMLVTSNGVGLGHLTRTLALARRLPPEVEPVVVTMSQAVGLVRDAGVPVEHLPYHEYARVDVERWNGFLRLELGEMLRFYDPAVLVFDGNMPYGGLMAAVAGRPAGWAAWMRRAMWRPGANTDALKRERAFDVVLEPGELAAAVDRGPTTRSRGLTRALAPVRLCDPAEMLPRAEARAALGLPAEGPCVLLQLGSGNNFDFARARRRAREVVAGVPGATLVAVESPIAEREAPEEPDARTVRLYPLGRHLAAFDAAVSAAGYNAFHELLLSGVPTLFVPNEHPIMDDQGARARWAERCGLALCAPASEPYALGRKLRALLLDHDRRLELATAMARLDRTNGASEAAAVVAEMAYTLRADRL